MTSEHQASRTLVKSPPELWAECSDAGSLARHIGEFGEIRITRLEPETSVAWEGELASGTVVIEPSGWGTRVTLTAWTEADEVIEQVDEPEAAGQHPLDELTEPSITEDEEEANAQVEETTMEPDPALAPAPAPAGGRWKRLIGRTRRWFKPDSEPIPVLYDEPESAPAPEPPPVAPEPEAIEPEPVAVEPEPVAVEPEPVAVEPEPEPANDSLDPEVILNGALDSLGQAHHRPFSRA